MTGRAENLSNQSRAFEKELAEARDKIAKYGEEIQYTHNEVVAKEHRKN